MEWRRDLMRCMNSRERMFEMTLDEIRACDKRNLAPSDVAEVLGVKPYSINVTVRLRGLGAYPFTLFLSGNRVRIPRKAFVEWAEKTRL